MSETVQIPVSLFRKMVEANEAFHDFEDELEDYLISQDENILSRLRKAQESHLEGKIRPFSDIQSSE